MTSTGIRSRSAIPVSRAEPKNEFEAVDLDQCPQQRHIEPAAGLGGEAAQPDLRGVAEHPADRHLEHLLRRLARRHAEALAEICRRYRVDLA